MSAKLSKSKILSGLQCEKRLWLETHKPQDAATSDSVERLFAIGHAVNDVARSLHKDGHLVEWDGTASSALRETQRVLEAHPEKPVFEATFAHQGVLIRADILKKEAGGYRLIEVKAGTSVKDPNYPDCAVQAWVLEGCGLSLDKVELAHIDNQFVYGGDHDYRGLLHHADLAGDIDELKKEVPEWVKKFQEVVAGKEPDIETGDHCHSPYACPFIGYCSGPDTEFPLSCLPGRKEIVKELEAEGVDDIRDIPPGRLTNKKQERVRKVTAQGKAEFKPAIKKIINGYSRPRYYLDFETISFAVPVWKGTRPYQHLPFQWSCHTEAQPGRYEHAEFLDTTGDAPMRPFIETLLAAVGKDGPIFVYSSYEKTCLNALVRRFADLESDINQVIHRLVDLLPLTREHYYHPDMRGSWSLKEVLPTITPNLSYGDLGEVQDGEAAGAAYLQVIHPDTEPQRRQSLINDLLGYCKRDTEALIALVNFLSTGTHPGVALP